MYTLSIHQYGIMCERRGGGGGEGGSNLRDVICGRPLVSSSPFVPLEIAVEKGNIPLRQARPSSFLN